MRLTPENPSNSFKVVDIELSIQVGTGLSARLTLKGIIVVPCPFLSFYYISSQNINIL